MHARGLEFRDSFNRSLYSSIKPNLTSYPARSLTYYSQRPNSSRQNSHLWPKTPNPCSSARQNYRQPNTPELCFSFVLHGFAFGRAWRTQVHSIYQKCVGINRIGPFRQSKVGILIGYSGNLFRNVHRNAIIILDPQRDRLHAVWICDQ